MKLSVIRQLADQHSLEALQKAEEALLETGSPEISVEGQDEGEQLTHILGAIWVLEQTQQGVPQRDALRAFAQKVRDSIN
jgi:hypothetical protein